ncbi:proline iminopeptidase [Roridomyces roridus]|uniref:Proline iminopeptidase n=1 Tax=Roridomyces roridus TaxID=1738132 RepID=A0AAD7BJI4_9AGAR|nr:proline iminopeptidase [Roridomyces roridus]
MTSPVEGEIDFDIAGAGKPCKTWYKIFGDLHSGRRPLVTLHGGPGASHSYILPFADLNSKYGIPVIFYDQIGTGNSTHLQEKNGDIEFWTEQLFLDELDNLLEKLEIKGDYDLLGHSWGGMLGSRHASLQPTGLHRLIIPSSPADMTHWVTAQNLLREKLPADVQATLLHHENAGTTESKEYMAAVSVFYKRHLCLIDPMPEPAAESMAWTEKDPTVYLTMNGPSEFHITGPLKTWSMLSSLHKIIVPTLLLNGRYDEAQDSCVRPFFEGIQGKVRWVTFAESSHMSHWEERERCMDVVSGFLQD